MDEGLLCIISTGCGQLVKLLRTLGQHGIFGSNFAYLFILTSYFFYKSQETLQSSINFYMGGSFKQVSISRDITLSIKMHKLYQWYLKWNKSIYCTNFWSIATWSILVIWNDCILFMSNMQLFCSFPGRVAVHVTSIVGLALVVAKIIVGK